MEVVYSILVLIGVILFIWLSLWLQAGEKRDSRAAGKPVTWSEKMDARDAQQAKIVCQYCQQAGGVTYFTAKRRRRLSATRVVGGFATLGASLPIAGTSKKNVVTAMSCSNCGMKWDVV